MDESTATGPGRDQAGPLDRRRFLRGVGGASALALAGGTGGLLAACGTDDGAPAPTTLGPVGTTAPAEPTDRAWTQLAAMLDGTVLRPGDAAYPQAALPSNLVYRDVRPPGIVRPAGAGDVQTTMRWAREEGIATVARSGGHSYAGYSTTSTGVVIDLSTLATIDLDVDTGEATIGAGALLGDVDDATTPQGWVVPAGRCRSVGIAGLLLGGGYGFNSRPFGLTSDNLVATDLVTAAGELVTVTATEDPDLFWALRGGGGGNFGINVGFRVRAHQVTQAAVYSLTWTDRSVFGPVWSAFQDVVAGAPEGFSLHLVAANAQPSSGGDGRSLAVIGQHLGTAAELRELLAPALAVAEPASATIEDQDLAGATTFLAEPGDPDAFLSKSAFYDRLGEEAIDQVLDWIDRFPTSGVTGDFTVIAAGGAVDRIAPTETAFVHRGVAYLNEGNASWPADAAPSTADEVRAWIEDMYAALADHLGPGAYQNFIDPTLDGWAAAYYGENLARLSATKARVDPDDHFRFAQSIPVG